MLNKPLVMKVWFFILTFLMGITPAFAESTAKTTFLGNRIAVISESFLGLPYLDDPLGEAYGYDRDPLYRFDGFDCVTYVETILALALSHDEDTFLNHMNEIRYRNSRVNFVSRNHFTSIDWISNNRQNGIISDVTKRIFKDHYQISETLIEKSAWFKKKHNMDVPAKNKISKLAYLPLQTAISNPELLENIRSGSIVNIVRPNWNLKAVAGTNLDISHQGFAIRKDDGILYFRNASTTAKIVQDEPMIDYLKRMTSIKSIGGINVLESKIQRIDQR